MRYIEKALFCYLHSLHVFHTNPPFWLLSMGNIHSEVSNHVEQIRVGNSGVIVLRKTKKSRGRQVEDAWTAEYSIGGTTCELGLTKTNRNKHDEELSISLHDHAPGPSNEDVVLQMDIKVEEDFLVSNLTLNGPRSLVQLPDCKSGNPHVQGGVLKSTSYFYGRDTDERKGVLVILRAKRSDDDEEWPYVITVKHYLFVSDVGLYVVAKISNDNGEGLSVQIEKPVKQHKRHLLSMFDDVKRNGWRPNYSNDFAIERSSLVSSNQNQGKVPVLCVGAKNNNPGVPDGYYSMSGQQNVSSVISTSGYTNGNYNGSLIFENCHVWFDKDGKMFRSYN